ncbi:hypothetical protein M513_13596 [Trichuris suis]|uniref:RNA-directed DNA polymerase n=1 Tax=Trichuris suis TaxID=68888 RepID=A0A085LKN1_9BILA|nr:hypothetical protein M513_13596 [Trichuris suis]
MARFYVWWPGLDRDIERMVSGCLTCQKYQRDPPEVPLVSWNMPSEPWARLHMDLAGPFKGSNWLVTVDAHSKWRDVVPLRNTTATSVIKHCRRLFTTFGLPRHIVTDNGPQFASDEFKQFCKKTSTPYHPRTNGLAERAARTFKERMNKTTYTDDLELSLQRFLFSYRNTPHSTTGRAPAELLIGHRLRNKLDLLKPSLKAEVDAKLFKQAFYHDQKAVQRSFKPGDKLFVTQPEGEPQQVGEVLSRTSETSYRVETDGKVNRCRLFAFLRGGRHYAEGTYN